MKLDLKVLVGMGMLISIPAFGQTQEQVQGAITTGQSTKANTQDPKPPSPESPEDKAYKEAMIKISNAIDQKISQIEAKQREIDGELYPAYRPPLQAELGDLQRQLKELELQRNQLQTQKTSKDMKKELEKTH